MNHIKSFVDLLARSEPQETAMDSCHYLHILGSLLAKKPERVLEIGIGTALLTVGLSMGLRFNQKGSLTCVDNWKEWHGIEPPEIAALKEAGVCVVAPVEERDFLAGCPDNAYDFVVSDGDHCNIAQWVDEYFRITTPGGFVYFHDTNNTGMFPSISRVQERVLELGLPCYHFISNSRSEERCERGLLMVINTKA